jgi:hypothetical protein
LPPKQDTLRLRSNKFRPNPHPTQCHPQHARLKLPAASIAGTVNSLPNTLKPIFPSHVDRILKPTPRIKMSYPRLELASGYDGPSDPRPTRLLRPSTVSITRLSSFPDPISHSAAHHRDRFPLPWKPFPSAKLRAFCLTHLPLSAK